MLSFTCQIHINYIYFIRLPLQLCTDCIYFMYNFGRGIFVEEKRNSGFTTLRTKCYLHTASSYFCSILELHSNLCTYEMYALRYFADVELTLSYYLKANGVEQLILTVLFCVSFALKRCTLKLLAVGCDVYLYMYTKKRNSSTSSRTIYLSYQEDDFKQT